MISQINKYFLLQFFLHKTRIWNIISRKRIPFFINSIQFNSSCPHIHQQQEFLMVYTLVPPFPSTGKCQEEFGCFIGCCKEHQRIKSHISTLVETFGQSDPGDFPWKHLARPSGNFMIKGSTWMAPWIFMLSMPLPRWKPTPLKRTNFQNALCMFNIESVRIHNKQWTCWFTKPNWFCHQRIQNCHYARNWERKYLFV